MCFFLLVFVSFFGGRGCFGVEGFRSFRWCGFFCWGFRVLRVLGVVGFRGSRTRDIALIALYGLLRLRYQLSDTVVALKHKAQGVEDIL